MIHLAILRMVRVVRVELEMQPRSFGAHSIPLRLLLLPSRPSTDRGHAAESVPCPETLAEGREWRNAKKKGGGARG